MKSFISILTLTLVTGFSANAANLVAVDCNKGNDVQVTGRLSISTTSDNEMVRREEATGTLTLTVEGDAKEFTVVGEYVTLKKGSYYKDQEVNLLTVNGGTKGNSLTVKTSNDPALRTDAERNRVIVDGYDAGTFSCHVGLTE